MSGWLTNGLPNVAESSVTGSEAIVVDTGLPNGQNPQTAKVTLAQLGLGGATTGIVAHAGGGQANATPIGYGTDVVSTVATAADSVMLPTAVVGAQCFVENAGANSMQVYGQLGDTINGLASANGIAQGAGVGAIYRCYQASGLTVGAWYRVQSS